ncbi:MAG TPA: LuxR C-terminal-related transcriptional regulator [Frankiaceae bacterium]|nr:LuxR C-terminal-related transcriptional regulator [Frankiaceae bacterium]
MVLDRLIEDIRGGESRALVLRGDAGAGKSALLDYLADQAAGLHVVRAAGVQAEMELAYAALHMVCTAMLGQLGRLPGPQRDALATAFGLDEGSPPDRFLIGLGVLGLLAEAGQDQPLLCIIDDAQWLDHASAQALAFVARRLIAESVAVVFAVRAPYPMQDLIGISELDVPGLPEQDARLLLRSALGGPIDERVASRLIAETRGNPLALLELPRGFTPTELASGFATSRSSTLPARIEESFQRQLEPLSPATRLLLLVAAAEPVGDAVLVRRAATVMGLAHQAGAVSAEGLVEIGALVRFRHPLVRSAIYAAATPDERRRVHAALAEATAPGADPDRRAWHIAQATQGWNEEVAQELERSAARAQARGGPAAAAAFLERAAELTPDARRRGERALEAAEAKHQAGLPEAALTLLAVAQAGPLEQLDRARAALLRGQIAFTQHRGRNAPSLLLRAAQQLEPLDVKLARETFLDALLAAMFAGRLASQASVREIAEAARLAPASLDPPDAADQLLDGLAVRFTDGYAPAVPQLRRAIEAFNRPELSIKELRWLWLALITAGNLWDEQTLDTERHVRIARETGALETLPLALTSRVGSLVLVGELAQAAALLDELRAVASATGIPYASYGALLLAAWQGREREAIALIEETTTEIMQRGEGFGLVLTGVARAVLYNGLGRYVDALSAAEHASKQPPAMGVEPWQAHVEIIEAATRSGRHERAQDSLVELRKSTQATGTEWGLGIEARCRALLSDGQEAQLAFEEAIERLGRTRIRGELARAQLLFGEWLRRHNRRSEARTPLRAAHERFVAMGMQAFAQRTAGELLATGGAVRKVTAEKATELTAQEEQIARLVREGLPNAEIAARLFISPRTVEWHLGKVFTKLGITSRRQLRRG